MKLAVHNFLHNSRIGRGGDKKVKIWPRLVTEASDFPLDFSIIKTPKYYLAYDTI